MLVIEGADPSARQKNSAVAQMSPQEAVEHFCAEGMTKNDAIKAAAKQLGMTRNQLYEIVMKK